MPASGVRSGARTSARTSGTVERAEAERQVVAELDMWRAHAIPDPAAPLDADDLARLVRECLAALGIDRDVGDDFSVNTVHYYRRRDILDAPAGRTSAARYGVPHLWQAVGARLAGHLGLLTLAEARAIMRGASERTLVAFVAARVLDARSRQLLRQTAAAAPAQSAERARPLPMPGVDAVGHDRARLGAQVDTRAAVLSLVIPLPGAAWCVVPAAHAAHMSPGLARELVQALASALRVPLTK